jgi:hypothetical protein
MFHVALVSDMNPVAEARVQSAYVTPTPTIFIDGGYRNVMGGSYGSLVPIYDPEIAAACQRAVPALDLVTALDWLGNCQVRVHVALGNGVTANTAPLTPTILSGGGRVSVLQDEQFSLAATDPEANMVFYQWDWGDGQISEWLGPYESGANAVATHSWADQGDYEVRVKVRDPFGEETAWSTPAAVGVTCCFGRTGDANGQGDYPDEITLGDVMLLVDVKFVSGDCGQLTCLSEADVNQDGGTDPTCDDNVTLGDIMTLVDFLFIAGPGNATLPECL